MKRPAILLGALCATTLATGCSTTVASLDGPGYRQKLSTPQTISVNLNPKADPESFHASVNGTDITEAFVFNENTGQLDGFVFEPTPGREPHAITISAEPALNAKGKPMGQPFSETLVFFPPKISLQGNVGIGGTSHVDVPRDGRTSVMIKLPTSPHAATAVTITPVVADGVTTLGKSAEAMTRCVSLNDSDPGQPITLIIPPGRRVAVFTVRGQQQGISALRVQAPGYVTSDIDVFIDGPTTTAAVGRY